MQASNPTLWIVFPYRWLPLTPRRLVYFKEGQGKLSRHPWQVVHGTYDFICDKWPRQPRKTSCPNNCTFNPLLVGNFKCVESFTWQQNQSEPSNSLKYSIKFGSRVDLIKELGYINYLGLIQKKIKKIYLRF
jgi:hypothetical protein